MTQSARYETQLKTLTSYVERMPTFSPATTKIVQLANNLAAPANEIVAAIRMDPILTGKVLQLVNSAYFSLAQKVTSLNRALVYLGINTIKNLALSTAVMESFDTKNKELAERVKPLWRHSLAAAVCARNLAGLMGVEKNKVEEYFVAGLLHDIGKIILVQAFFATAPHPGNLTIEAEKEKYGLSHAGVGGVILKRWSFPVELGEAIAHHHDPAAPSKLGAFLWIADAMTYRLALNGVAQGETEAKPEERPIPSELWKVVGFEEPQALSVLETAAEQIEKAEVFLNIASSKEKVVEQE